MRQAGIFGYRERGMLRKSLESLAVLAPAGRVSEHVIRDIGAVCKGSGVDPDLRVDVGLVAFTAIDGGRYFASKSGLWALKPTGLVHPDPREWWLAFLRTHAFFMALRRGGWF